MRRVAWVFTQSRSVSGGARRYPSLTPWALKEVIPSCVL